MAALFFLTACPCIAFESFRQNLLLPPTPIAPQLDSLSQLDKAVIVRYTVGANEDLWTLCHRYHLDQFSIRSSNDLDGNSLDVGTVLKIPNHKGTIYVIQSTETLQSVSRGFTRGKTLGPAYDREILLANDFPTPNLREKGYPFDAGTVLFLPEAYKPTGLPIPFGGGGRLRITSNFSLHRRHPVLGITRAHHGMDIAKPYGFPVLTSREGIVVSAGWMGGYGNMIEIRHSIKSKRGTRVFTTRYGHLSKIFVTAGQHVHLYQLIGRVGSTGISTGPHLHFEVRDESGRPSNPAGH